MKTIIASILALACVAPALADSIKITAEYKGAEAKAMYETPILRNQRIYVETYKDAFGRIRITEKKTYLKFESKEIDSDCSENSYTLRSCVEQLGNYDCTIADIVDTSCVHP